MQNTYWISMEVEGSIFTTNNLLCHKVSTRVSMEVEGSGLNWIVVSLSVVSQPVFQWRLKDRLTL